MLCDALSRISVDDNAGDKSEWFFLQLLGCWHCINNVRFTWLHYIHTYIHNGEDPVIHQRRFGLINKMSHSQSVSPSVCRYSAVVKCTFGVGGHIYILYSGLYSYLLLTFNQKSAELRHTRQQQPGRYLFSGRANDQPNH